jgi:hypothetical protein
MEGTARRMRLSFVWMLPACWAACSLLQHACPGDEYGFYALSALPGMWIAPFAFRSVSMEHVGPCIALAGVPPLALIGLAMDRVRVRKRRWGALWLVTGLVVFGAVLFSFPSIDRAIRKNGSLMAYMLLGATAGLYAACLLSLVGAGAAWITKRLRAGVTSASAQATPSPPGRRGKAGAGGE